MPRFVVLVVVVLLIAGALVFLSTLPRERPTRTVEVAVQGGNAH